MEIYNLDDGKTYTLRMIDRRTGIDWARDWIGDNSGITYNEALDRYEVSTPDLDYWIALQGEYQAIYDLQHDLTLDHGIDAVQAVIDGVGSVEFDQYPSIVFRALTDRFGIFR
jgi:hypothetical protein